MHPYSINSNERKNILLIIAGVSILLTWTLDSLTNYYEIMIPWWIENPSILFFYGGLYFIFDRWLWKLCKPLDLIKTPILEGEWIGYAKSSYDNHSSKVEGKLRIYQSWSNIKLLIDFKDSTSCSDCGSIAITPEGSYLSYQYINEPKPGSVQTMNIHRGSARLFYDEKKNTLAGEYYTGRGRQNFGSLEFRRIKDEK